MISDVKIFMEIFFTAELNARNGSIRPDIVFFNNQLDVMNSYCITELHDSFGMIKQKYSESDDFYEDYKDSEYTHKRLLFKISKYNNKKYGELYLAYISMFSSIKQTYKIFECLFIGKINNEYKIIRSFWFAKGDGIIPSWNGGVGDHDINFETAGELVAIERYIEPADDEYSMEEYRKDE